MEIESAAGRKTGGYRFLAPAARPSKTRPLPRDIDNGSVTRLFCGVFGFSTASPGVIIGQAVKSTPDEQHASGTIQ